MTINAVVQPFILRPNFVHNLSVIGQAMARKALLIGICYSHPERFFKDGRSAKLDGSHRDVQNVKKLLIDRFQYTEQDIVLYMDDGVHVEPTRANIINGIKQLVADAQPGDHLFFHFSGHGSQVDDETDGDEIDGKDETIWPLDFVEDAEETYIIDDELRLIMVDRKDPPGMSPLPAGCQLTALFDSCHSGTVLDLPIEYAGTPRVKPIDLPPEDPQTITPDSVSPGGSPISETRTHPLRHQPSTILRLFDSPSSSASSEGLRTRIHASHGLLGLPFSVQNRARGVRTISRKATLVTAEPDAEVPNVSKALVTSWAACADDESAYEAEGKTGEGAMAQFFVQSINEIHDPKDLTYENLLEMLSEKLNDYCEKANQDRPVEEHIRQIPQLGSLHKLDFRASFTL